MEDINLVTVGHVDHGKSTVVGRLLVDTNSLPDGKIDAVKEMCEQQAKVFEYAYLLDALKDEQSQGITIDSARCFFKTKNRKVLLRDTPGHLEFLRNMITGASTADAALLVIDASEGMKENSKRHSYLLSILGISQVAVIINKMDLVEYSEDVFNEVKEQCKEYLEKIGINAFTYIPVSAKYGDNIALKSVNMQWYNGDMVLDVIDRFEVKSSTINMPFRMPLQAVYRFSEDNDNRRIFAGTVLSGKAVVGDEFFFYPSGKHSKIKSVESYNGKNTMEISSGNAVGFTLEDEIYVKRGELVTLGIEKSPLIAEEIVTKLFWVGEQPLRYDRRYYIKLGHAKIEIQLREIRELFDAENLKIKSNNKYIPKNHIAECVFVLKEELAFDIDIFETSRFVIVDDYEISGGGIITGLVDTASGGDLFKMKNQIGRVIWFTGQSGSGKTTIAKALEAKLIKCGLLVYRLDGDNLRKGLNSDLGFSVEDRKENIRRIAEVAKLFAEAGVITLVSTISPLKEIRSMSREILTDTILDEFYIKASLKTCRERDPKGLYKSNFNGSEVVEYEEDNYTKVIDTEQMTVEEEVCEILKIINLEEYL